MRQNHRRGFGVDRHGTRGTRERFLAHADDFMMVLNAYQPPGGDEVFLTYEAGEPIGEWIARMLP